MNTTVQYDTRSSYEDETTSSDSYDSTRFLVLETSVSVFTVINLYIILSFMLYEHRRPRRQRTSLRKQFRPSKQLSTRAYAKLMRYETILAALFLLLRYICEHYELLAQYLGAPAYDYCDLIMKLKIALTAVSVSFVYGFLWTRQSFFYSDRSMKHLSSCTTKAISSLSLVCLFFAEIVCTILFTATRFYSLTPEGCLLTASSIPDYIAWVCLTISTVAFQFLLFGLFVYPIAKHKTMVITNTSRSKFVPMIKRAAVSAFVCILSDITASILILFAKDDYNIIPTLAFDASALVNVISLIGSFRDWRPRVCAFCACGDDNRHSGDISDNESFSRRVKSQSQRVENIVETVWSVTGSQKSNQSSEPRSAATATYNNTAIDGSEDL